MSAIPDPGARQQDTLLQVDTLTQGTVPADHNMGPDLTALPGVQGFVDQDGRVQSEPARKLGRERRPKAVQEKETQLEIISGARNLQAFPGLDSPDC